MSDMPTKEQIEARITALEKVKGEKLAMAKATFDTEIGELKSKAKTELKENVAKARSSLKEENKEIRKASRNAVSKWSQILKTLEADAQASQ